MPKKSVSKKDKIVNKLVGLIQNHKEYGEIPMQFLLVKFGGRKAFLLETTSYEPSLVQKILALAKEIGLHVSKDRLGLKHAPRYLIYNEVIRLPRTDEELGTLLGFKDPGGEYADGKQPRTTLLVAENESGASTAELVQGSRSEIEKFAEKKVNSFNQVMIKLGLPYRFEYGIQTDDGTLIRADKLEKLNMKYVRENKHKYIEDLWNELSGNDHPFILLFNHVIKNKNLLMKYLPFYTYFYRLINEDGIDNKTIVKRLNKKFCEFLKE